MKSRTHRVVSVALGLACSLAVSVCAQMTVGTNIWYPGWGGTDTDPFTAGYQNVTGTNPWRQQFIDEVSHYTAIRFMDLGGLNSDEAPSNWAARTPKSSRDQMPMAYEWMIDMCNRAGTDMWICIPYLWDQDLAGCRSLAQLIHSTLDAGSRVYVEYGNENWSEGYNQIHCRQRGVAVGLGTVENQTTGDRYSAYASMKIWEEFEAVFGKGSPRLVKVLSGWDINSQVTSVQLAFLVTDTVRNPKRTLPDLYTVAPYINEGSVAAARAALGTMAQNLRSHNSVLARAGGIPLGCYEGGFGNTNHEAMASDPAVYALTRSYLDTLNRYTRGVFNHLNHSCRPWGAKMYIGQPLAEAHIYRALIDWNQQHPVTVQRAPHLAGTGVVRGERNQAVQVYMVNGRLAHLTGASQFSSVPNLLVAPGQVRWERHLAQ